MLKRSLSFIGQVRDLINPFAPRINLDVLLAQADPKALLHVRVDWLQNLVAWLRSPVSADERASLKVRGGRIQTVRIRFLLHLLDRNLTWKTNVAGVVRSILRETSSLELFSSTGLTRESGFFSEASNRLMRQILPTPADERDLAALFTKIFCDPTDGDWVESLPPELFARITEIVRYGAENDATLFEPLRKSMADALIILAPNISSLGLSHDLRVRMSSTDVAGSPFRALHHRLQDIYTTFDRHVPLHRTDESLKDLGEAEIQACRDRIRDVYQHLDEAGVSVSIVFKLETLSASLTRVETLLRILIPHPDADQMATTQTFLADLIRESLAAAGLSDLVRSNLDMISRKIVERVGVSGEHYITTNRSEYWSMLKSGAGGGLVTVGTTLLKFALTKASLPLFFEGLFLWLNYSGSFLLMQAMHFSLATKQPSMTAAALANKLRLLSHRRHLQEFVDEVARITRSQIAAAIGNVGFVVPAALLFDLTVVMLTGRHVLTPEYASKTIHLLNPFTSLTIPAAAITGVLLWASSVTGGWIENWAVYRRLPEAIASNRRLCSVFGEDRAQRLAQSFSRGIAAVGSNIAIGFYLAFTPIVGRFFGAPLDIRHITLSSGSLAFSVAAIGWEGLDKTAFGFACLGLVCILLLNFGVSYALALSVAVRARRIKRAWVFHLLRAVGHRLRTNAAQFFFPTKEQNATVEPN